MDTKNELIAMLSYSPETGDFTWIKHSKKHFIGKKAGHKDSRGYHRFHFKGCYYMAHRLAFLYMIGSIPDCCDHINQIRNDNRWKNLRTATKSENAINSKLKSTNSSGFKGVCWNKKTSKWQASITIDKKQKHLGLFTCKKEAHAAYLKEVNKYYGKFAPDSTQTELPRSALSCTSIILPI